MTDGGPGVTNVWRSEPAPTHPVESIRWWRTIRFRLTATLALVGVLTVTVFGLVTARAVLTSTRGQQRHSVIATLQSGTAAYLFAERVNPAVTVGTMGTPRVLIAALGSRVVATWDDGSQFWAARRLGDGTVLSVHESDAVVLARWRHLRMAIFELAGAVALLAIVAGWVVAGRLTLRLRRTAIAAQRISAGDLSQRAFSSGHDEIAALARAVDTMTASLVERIDHERSLTADAAHELRTPLTALVSATELLDDAPDSRRVRQLVSRLRLLVGDLLRLAQLENESRQAVMRRSDLGELLAEVLAEIPDAECRLFLDNPARVDIDVAGAHRVIGNVIGNAVQHGAAPIDVTVSRNSVIIVDHGAGFPPELLEHGPRRFHPIGPSGRTGLGLTIAARELRAMGAVLSLTNAESGARAAIEFNPGEYRSG